MLENYSISYCKTLKDTYPKAYWQASIKPHSNGIELSVWPKGNCDHGASWPITIEEKHYLPEPKVDFFDHDICVINFVEAIELAGFFIKHLNAQFYSFASASFIED